MIPNALIGLQPEEVSGDRRNRRPYNLEIGGRQKQIKLR
jgi:hypothetical protein